MKLLFSLFFIAVAHGAYTGQNYIQNSGFENGFTNWAATGGMISWIESPSNHLFLMTINYQQTPYNKNPYASLSQSFAVPYYANGGAPQAAGVQYLFTYTPYGSSDDSKWGWLSFYNGNIKDQIGPCAGATGQPFKVLSSGPGNAETVRFEFFNSGLHTYIFGIDSVSITIDYFAGSANAYNTGANGAGSWLSNSGDILSSHSRFLTSPNSNYRLIPQIDGTLKVFDGSGNTVWTSGTYFPDGIPRLCRVGLKEDTANGQTTARLAVFCVNPGQQQQGATVGSGETLVWTNDHPVSTSYYPFQLKLDNSGYLTLYDNGNNQLWTTHTVRRNVVEE